MAQLAVCLLNLSFRHVTLAMLAMLASKSTLNPKETAPFLQRREWKPSSQIAASENIIISQLYLYTLCNCRDAMRCYEAMCEAAPWRSCRPLDIRFCSSEAYAPTAPSPPPPKPCTHAWVAGVTNIQGEGEVMRCCKDAGEAGLVRCCRCRNADDVGIFRRAAVPWENGVVWHWLCSCVALGAGLRQACCRGRGVGHLPCVADLLASTASPQFHSSLRCSSILQKNTAGCCTTT